VPLPTRWSLSGSLRRRFPSFGDGIARRVQMHRCWGHLASAASPRRPRGWWNPSQCQARPADAHGFGLLAMQTAPALVQNVGNEEHDCHLWHARNAQPGPALLVPGLVSATHSRLARPPLWGRSRQARRGRRPAGSAVQVGDASRLSGRDEALAAQVPATSRSASCRRARKPMGASSSASGGNVPRCNGLDGGERP
jgi:hypothetical protein